MLPRLLLGAFLLLAVTLTGCGRVTKASVEKEIDALKAEVAKAKDETQAKALQEKIEKIRKKIDSLPKEEQATLHGKLTFVTATKDGKTDIPGLKDSSKFKDKDASIKDAGGK
jgi:hypothetical protein